MKNQGQSVEEWREIKNVPGFFISSFGRVRKDPALRKRIFTTDWIYIKPVKVGRYLYFGCYPYKKRLPVHSTVLKTFIGDPPKDCECDHRDREGTNNHLTNLRWLPVNKNRSHPGSKNGSSKLKEGEVWLIKRILASDALPKRKRHSTLSKMFHIHRRTIRRIEEGEKWKHVTI